MRKKEKGFTLIELAIVIGLIALLIGGLSVYSGFFGRDTAISSAVSYIKDWKQAIDRYKGIYTNPPSSITDNSFDSRFLKTTANIPNISFVRYTRTGCNSKASITLRFGDSNTLNGFEAEMQKRGWQVCNKNTGQLTIDVVVE